MGLAVGPLCDRERDTDVAKSQAGFFTFIVTPWYAVVGDLAGPLHPPFLQVEANAKAWASRHAPSYRKTS